MHDAIRICPGCGAETRGTGERCAGCGTRLIFREQLAGSPSRLSFGRLEEEEEQIVLREVDGSLAQKLSSDLNRGGIPHRLEPSPASGGLVLKVAAGDLEAAREIERARRRARRLFR